MSEKKEIKYLSVKEVAEKLDITTARVLTYCNQNRFEVAKKLFDYPKAPWMIPEESLKTLVVRKTGRAREKGIKKAMKTGMYSFYDFCVDQGITESDSPITQYIELWGDQKEVYISFCQVEGFKNEDLTGYLKEI